MIGPAAVKPRRLALDSNVLVYAADSRDPIRQQRAVLIVGMAARTRRCLLSMQTIGEFYHASTRKGLIDREEAARRATDYMTIFEIADPVSADARHALATAASGTYSYWDALLLTTLGRGGCSMLLSEDMQDGSMLAGVVVRNPFGGNDLPDDLRGCLS